MSPIRTLLLFRHFVCLASVGLTTFGVLPANSWALPPLSARTVDSETAVSSPGEGHAASSESTEDIDKRIEELTKRIAATEATLGRDGQADQTHEGAAILAVQRDMMKYLAASLHQRKAIRESIEELQAKLQEQESDRRLAVGPATPPPYSLLMLEDLRNQLAAVKVQQASLGAEIATTRDLLKLVRQTYEQRERERRAARDALKRNRVPAATARLNGAFETALLSSSIAEETVRLREAQLEEKEVMREVRAFRREYLEEQIRVIGRDVSFSESDLQKVFQELADRETSLKKQIEVATTSLQDIQEKWLDAKNRLGRSPDDLLEEEVAAWQAARDCRQKEVAVLNQRMAENAVLRSFWQARYLTFNKKATPEDMEKWRQQVAGFIDRLTQARGLADLDFERCRTDLALLEARRNEARQRPDLAPWIQFQADEQKHMMGTHARVFLDIEAASEFLDRFQVELDEALGVRQDGHWLARAGEWTRAAWNYEITSVADEPITTRKIVAALVLLLVGWGISRTASRALGRRVLPKFGLDGGNAAALQTIAFYLLFVLFGYFTLELLGVPLTVFAFLGGAVAIGVGFGSQNILNNFISGLILLFERPIRVGDLVNIDGTYANIERVGARSTRVRTGSNLEMIIPNSRFLENNVTNLTLSDERFRASVCVGAAYGSPTRRVAELLEKAVVDHPDVLDTPDPIILFKDFADNSLNFEVHFWIRMRTVMQGQRIESDVRHTIDDLFREADITIAFPQRDIHVDTSSPIEVRLQAAEAAKAPYPRRAA